jgi:hypothetical protein
MTVPFGTLLHTLSPLQALLLIFPLLFLQELLPLQDFVPIFPSLLLQML